jgi:hypothetical protein
LSPWNARWPSDAGLLQRVNRSLKRDPKQAAQLTKARAGAAIALQRAEEGWLAASSHDEKATG